MENKSARNTYLWQVGSLFWPWSTTQQASLISRNNSAGHYRRVATAPLRFLFHFDTGSDGLVVVGLYNKCHTYYAINVLTVIVLPGVIYGWYIRSTERRNKEKIPTWMVPFAPLWFIPYSMYKLFLAILESSGGPGPGKL